VKIYKILIYSWFASAIKEKPLPGKPKEFFFLVPISPLRYALNIFQKASYLFLKIIII
jgi:hypothetical protein